MKHWVSLLWLLLLIFLFSPSASSDQTFRPVLQHSAAMEPLRMAEDVPSPENVHPEHQLSFLRQPGIESAEYRAEAYRQSYERCDPHHRCVNATAGKS